MTKRSDDEDVMYYESPEDGSSAILSQDGRYRLMLTRAVGDRRLTIVNLFDLRSSDPRLLASPEPGLPPCSAANDDAISRGLRAAWKHRHVVFVMLNPSTVDAFKDDPTVRSCKRFAQAVPAGVVIAAWGQGGPAHLVKERASRFLELCHEADAGMERRTVYSLGTTKSGMPRHPLFIAADAGRLRPWRTIMPLGRGDAGAQPARSTR